jgi:hypothetical protein
MLPLKGLRPYPLDGGAHRASAACIRQSVSAAVPSMVRPARPQILAPGLVAVARSEDVPAEPSVLLATGADGSGASHFRRGEAHGTATAYTCFDSGNVSFRQAWLLSEYPTVIPNQGIEGRAPPVYFEIRGPAIRACGKTK